MTGATEWIEQKALSDLGRAARTAGIELCTESVGEALVLRSRAIPSLMLNRVLGLGFDPDLSRSTLEEIVERFRKDEISRLFVHLYDEPQPSELVSWLEELGIVRYHRSWNKLARGRDEPLPESTTSLTVREATPGDAEQVASLLCEGFDLPSEGGRAFSAVIGRPGWYASVGLDRGVIVSTGLLFIEDRIGYLVAGATTKTARGRGAQLALMADRCRVALDRGCELIASETGAPAPGDPQHSHRNMERCGLRVAATRHNYAPTGTIWEHGRRDRGQR